MSLTHTITAKVQTGSGFLDHSVALTAGAEHNVSEAIEASQTDYLVAWTCDFSQLKSLYMYSDVAMTVETNNGSAPGQTIALAAGKPLVWYYGSGITCPITVDVTALYITNVAAGTLEIRSLEDPTV
jgi:hypothetical protein